MAPNDGPDEDGGEVTSRIAPYAIVPLDLLSVPAEALRVWVALWSFTREHFARKCRVKVGTLSAQLGLADKTVRRCLKALEDTGRLTITRTGRSCSFRLDETSIAVTSVHSDRSVLTGQSGQKRADQTGHQRPIRPVKTDRSTEVLGSLRNRLPTSSNASRFDAKVDTTVPDLVASLPSEPVTAVQPTSAPAPTPGTLFTAEPSKAELSTAKAKAKAPTPGSATPLPDKPAKERKPQWADLQLPHIQKLAPTMLAGDGCKMLNMHAHRHTRDVVEKALKALCAQAIEIGHETIWAVLETECQRVKLGKGIQRNDRREAPVAAAFRRPVGPPPNPSYPPGPLPPGFEGLDPRSTS